MSTIQPVALVTGVSSGIGRAIAETFAGAGFRVYGSIRSDTSGVPAGVQPLRLDVRDSASIDAAVARVLAESKRIDVLVNNAGGVLSGAVEETDIEQAQALFDVNFFGVARVTRAVLPAMRAQHSGRIIFISSLLGFLPGPFTAYYAASKHAIEAYAESLDHEVRTLGVRALLVEPGFIRTRIGENGVDAARPLDAYAGMRARVNRKVEASVQAGDDPKIVASKVLEAATNKTPRLRYPVGTGAKKLSLLRSFLPAGMLDSGLRKDFQLDG
jgi:NAD(P)-dependent dehydrogenase (short-subunit alcohol dehydrogenase family)